MSGLVACKYSSLPTMRRYRLASTLGSALSLSNFRFCSIGKALGLHPCKPQSSKISKIFGRSLPTTITSSTYIKAAVKLLCSLKMKREWSALDCLKPRLRKNVVNF